MKTTLVVDPPGCGCTDCITRQATPLNQLTLDELIRWLCGKTEDRTNAGTLRTVQRALQTAQRRALDDVYDQVQRGDLP